MFVQVWGSLVSNVISVLIGLAGVAYTCWLLAECPPSDRFCDQQSFIEFKDVEGLRRTCSQNFYKLNVSLSLSGLQGRTLGAPQIWSRGLPWAQEQVVLCVYFLFQVVLYGLLGLFLVLLVLQTCVTIVVCVFSGKAFFSQRKTPPTNNINSASQEMLMCSVAREKKRKLAK